MTNHGQARSRTPAHVLSSGDLRVKIYRNEHKGRYLFNFVVGRNYLYNGAIQLGSSLGEADLEPMRILLAEAKEWIGKQPRAVEPERLSVPAVPPLEKPRRSLGTSPGKGAIHEDP
jgi:hypothetical protein